MEKTTIATIPLRGVRYCIGDKEIGSIVVRPEHIAFIAGTWCEQIPRRAKQSVVIALSREHNKRMESLIRKHGLL